MVEKPDQMQEFIEGILKGLLGPENFKEIKLEVAEAKLAYTLTINSPRRFRGLLIGKKGKTANSIRNLMDVKGRLIDKRRYVLSIYNVDDSGEGKTEVSQEEEAAETA